MRGVKNKIQKQICQKQTEAIKTLQDYGSNNLLFKPSRFCQQRRGEIKSNCSEKDVQPINPIK